MHTHVLCLSDTLDIPGSHWKHDTNLSHQSMMYRHIDCTLSKLTWLLTYWGCDPSVTTMSSPVFSRLQHHESAGGQRESTWKQRPALGRCWRREPRRRPGPGHASSDSCVAQPQISPLPAHAYASPPAAHAPPAGRSHCAQCGRRVLIFSAASALLPRVDWLLIKDYF